jgi:small subunit ribosomal protein S16
VALGLAPLPPRLDLAGPLAAEVGISTLRPLLSKGTKANDMAVKLRLMRMGKTKQPTYRLVAADSRSPRDGRFIEIVGSYAPRQEQNKVVLKPELVTKWLNQGAQPTDRVRRLLAGAGLMEAAPVRVPKEASAAPARKAK